MSAWDDIVSKKPSERTRIEKCIINMSSSDFADERSFLAMNAAAELEYLKKVRIAAQEFINARNNAHDLSTIVECEDALETALKGVK